MKYSNEEGFIEIYIEECQYINNKLFYLSKYYNQEMNTRVLTTIWWWIIWWAAWRKSWAWEVVNFFPHFHETHWYKHEAAGTFLGVLLWGVAVNIAIEIAWAITKKRKNKQTNISQW